MDQLIMDYVNEAIVEEQAKERGAHASLFRNSRLHDGFHRGEEVFASVCVEICRELSVCAPHDKHKERQSHKELEKRSH
ncbi:hypothetical protein CICLE_v10033987mg [Citrus x clementina]|uniref:Uncharacterized protein n=1 Tax=Citrus clementina TaxID=85681 RepID=V4SMT2_CITCL|nr:hypothetical protein CICLE_v10033987mg [Citrus x clementina]